MVQSKIPIVGDIGAHYRNRRGSGPQGPQKISIARDLGEAFQFPVHLAGLRRNAIGSFLLNEDCWRPGEEVRIRPPHEVLTWPRVKASDAEVRSLLFGQTPRLQMPSGSQFAWIVGADGLPVAWAEVLDYGLYRVRRIMKG